jgi:hypothetical protein
MSVYERLIGQLAWSSYRELKEQTGVEGVKGSASYGLLF